MDTAMRHLQLKQFRQLIAIAEKGTIRQAAVELSISQPALSRSIRGIEESLSVKLMNRGPRGAELTEFGKILVNYGKILEFNIRFAAEEIDELRGNKVGQVKLGIGPGVSVIDIAIDRLLEKRPNSHVSVIENNSENLGSSLLNGSIDIMLGPPQLDKTTPGLKTETLAGSQLVFALRAEHPLAGKTGVSLKTISEADWILPGPKARVHTLFNNIFIEKGLAPPKGPIIMDPRPGAISLLKRRNLICMVPRQLIIRELIEGSMVILPIPNQSLFLPLALTTREFDKLGPACRDMISVIKRIGREMKNNK